MNKFGAYIRSTAKDQGLSYRELARRARITTMTLYKLENNAQPDIATLVSIAGALKTTPRVLLETLGVDVDQVPASGDEVAG